MTSSPVHSILKFHGRITVIGSKVISRDFFISVEKEGRLAVASGILSDKMTRLQRLNDFCILRKARSVLLTGS